MVPWRLGRTRAPPLDQIGGGKSPGGQKKGAPPEENRGGETARKESPEATAGPRLATYVGLCGSPRAHLHSSIRPPDPGARVGAHGLSLPVPKRVQD